MNVLEGHEIAMHWREDGDPEGPAVVFCNSLGTDLRLWEALMPLLPRGLRYVRFDNRGHGLTEATSGPYDLDMLVGDAEALVETVVGGPAIFVGLSIGGIIGQGLALRRPDLVRALVLSNTAARFGTAELWQERIDQVEASGVSSMTEAILDRWFSKGGRHAPGVALWREMVSRTPDAGYAGCCHALRDADLSDRLGELSLPVLCIGGDEDGATPPDVMEALAARIEGARLHVIEGTGHLPCVEKPRDYAAILTPFLKGAAT